MNRYIEGYEQKATNVFRTEAENLAKKFAVNAEVKNGIVRWKSNKRVPPTDVLEFWAYLGFNFDLVASLKAQEEETAAFIAAYRKNYKGPTEVNILEARAAHGPGVELVNVITGHKWTT